jgi:tetratricopeptide (TPR) repeat protein
MIRGGVLCDIAAYEQAVRELEQSTQRDHENAMAHAFKGWALENLGQVEQAEQAYEKAIGLEPGNLRWHQGWAEALYLQGRKEEAAEQHRWIIEEIWRRNEDIDTDDLSLLGWCYYRLDKWEMAMRLFDKALSIKFALVPPRFDLALVATCSGRYSLGLENYQHGVRLVNRKEPLARRGMLYVARRQLQDACSRYDKLAEEDKVQEACGLLITAYRETDQAAANLQL